MNIERDVWFSIAKQAVKEARWKRLQPFELDVLRSALSATSLEEFKELVFRGNEDLRTWNILLMLRNKGLLFFTLDNNYQLQFFKNNEWLLERVNDSWNEYLKKKEVEDYINRRRM
jgi:hypothetical protein